MKIDWVPLKVDRFGMAYLFLLDVVALGLGLWVILR